MWTLPLRSFHTQWKKHTQLKQYCCAGKSTLGHKCHPRKLWYLHLLTPNHRHTLSVGGTEALQYRLSASKNLVSSELVDSFKKIRWCKKASLIPRLLRRSKAEPKLFKTALPCRLRIVVKGMHAGARWLGMEGMDSDSATYSPRVNLAFHLTSLCLRFLICKRIKTPIPLKAVASSLYIQLCLAQSKCYKRASHYYGISVSCPTNKFSEAS